MKITNDDKIEMYRLRKLGVSISELSTRYKLYKSNITYLLALFDRHGFSILKVKNNKYSSQFKLEAINRILHKKESINSVSIDLGLPNIGTLASWVSNFKKNGYTLIEKTRGRPTMKKKSKNTSTKQNIPLTPEHRLKQLEEENLYLRAENALLKKLEALMKEEEQEQDD